MTTREREWAIRMLVRCGVPRAKARRRLAAAHADGVRRIVAIADADNVLRTFAREQALLVIHLWDAPAIVREYLETGNEEIRAAAWAAARDAARAAANDLLESMFLADAEWAPGEGP